MNDPLLQGLAELFYAAGHCAEKGDLKGVALCQNAIPPLLAEVDARLNPVAYEVWLDSFGDKKINVIKEVRACISLNLKQAKDLVESAPTKVMTVTSLGDAEVYARKLRTAGAQATVRSMPSPTATSASKETI